MYCAAGLSWQFMERLPSQSGVEKEGINVECQDCPAVGQWLIHVHNKCTKFAGCGGRQRSKPGDAIQTGRQFQLGSGKCYQYPKEQTIDQRYGWSWWAAEKMICSWTCKEGG